MRRVLTSLLLLVGALACENPPEDPTKVPPVSLTNRAGSAGSAGSAGRDSAGSGGDSGSAGEAAAGAGGTG